VTPEERNQLQYLCKRVEEEKDPNEFDRLVLELNELLDQKQTRIHSKHKSETT
jgi:hypothetical protein